MGVPGSRSTEGNPYFFLMGLAQPDDFKWEKCAAESNCDDACNFGQSVVSSGMIALQGCLSSDIIEYLCNVLIFDVIL